MKFGAVARRRPEASAPASGITVSGCGVSVFIGGGVGVAVAPAASERRLYPLFDCAAVGAGLAVAGAGVAAAVVEGTAAAVEEGGASAARASASERWFANVFWDWRILRTAGVTLPCVAFSHVSFLSLNSSLPIPQSPTRRLILHAPVSSSQSAKQHSAHHPGKESKEKGITHPSPPHPSP